MLMLLMHFCICANKKRIMGPHLSDHLTACPYSTTRIMDAIPAFAFLFFAYPLIFSRWSVEFLFLEKYCRHLYRRLSFTGVWRVMQVKLLLLCILHTCIYANKALWAHHSVRPSIRMFFLFNHSIKSKKSGSYATIPGIFDLISKYFILAW